MIISKCVVEQLEQLATKGPEAVAAAFIESREQREYIIGVPTQDQGPGIAVTITDYDRYSIALANLEVTYKNRFGVDYDLRQHAEDVANRLNYLDEPLALVELDTEKNVAQLRSHRPHQDNETATYWEVMISTEPYLRATLTRYCWSPQRSDRERSIYPATFATVGRIASDLALCL